ncbi:MAG: hydrogenase maturation protease [Coriobacteriia bacterium]
MRYLIGVGTYSGLDDSIGLRVAEAVSARGLERGFKAIEIGGSVLDLVHYLDDGVESVLVVDTARMGRAPGEWVIFEPGDVTSRKDLSGVSTHEGDVLGVVRFAVSLGRPMPQVTFLGIEPAQIGSGIGVSPELDERFEEYVEASVAFCMSRGSVRT